MHEGQQTITIRPPATRENAVIHLQTAIRPPDAAGLTVGSPVAMPSSTWKVAERAYKRNANTVKQTTKNATVELDAYQKSSSELLHIPDQL